MLLEGVNAERAGERASERASIGLDEGEGGGGKEEKTSVRPALIISVNEKSFIPCLSSIIYNSTSIKTGCPVSYCRNRRRRRRRGGWRGLIVFSATHFFISKRGEKKGRCCCCCCCWTPAIINVINNKKRRFDAILRPLSVAALRDLCPTDTRS